MSDSPVSDSPYAVLGVPTDASDDDLRKAYRRLLRETHPDTGGSPARFIAVQQAWELVGTPEARAAFDRGQPAGGGERPSWAPPKPSGAQTGRPSARSYGHPGGWRRERYLRLLAEWAGRGTTVPDPYDPAVVRSAPREIRRILADALAEEATARLVSDLGIGFTVWHDVATGDPADKLDHVVLGPTGLFALLSEDFGGPVQVRRGEVDGVSVEGDKPLQALASRAKVLARAARVKFGGLLLVVPDDALAEPVIPAGAARGAAVAVVRRSVLPHVLREGLPGARVVGGNELFDVRSRLQAAVTFV
ncbi:MAG: molecular chaperone DnaJ [Naasia sp.]|uniref:J domain-containing protein n=1 Tax=Naasia sp. TaxID=2546198 RepID=UPI00261AC80E|nr:J domain-containing protein [Naasia sp.]MCU1570750.1 molecular chaperone DnaJ [Naasia sp.]